MRTHHRKYEEIQFPSDENPFSPRMKINFHTGENPFSWVRKSIFMGMKIVDHPEKAIDKVGITFILLLLFS